MPLCLRMQIKVQLAPPPPPPPVAPWCLLCHAAVKRMVSARCASSFRCPKQPLLFRCCICCTWRLYPSPTEALTTPHIPHTFPHLRVHVLCRAVASQRVQRLRCHAARRGRAAVGFKVVCKVRRVGFGLRRSLWIKEHGRLSASRASTALGRAGGYEQSIPGGGSQHMLHRAATTSLMSALSFVNCF
eukprot:350112-Chlamydomonas_euryale.AAC.1